MDRPVIGTTQPSVTVRSYYNSSKYTILTLSHILLRSTAMSAAELPTPKDQQKINILTLYSVLESKQLGYLTLKFL